MQLRSKTTGKVFDSAVYQQFSEHIEPDSAEVDWRPDGKAFILSRMMTRGASGSEVYAFTGNKLQLLDIPRFDTKFSNNPAWQGYGKGWFVAVGWTPEGLLKMNLLQPVKSTAATGEELDDVVDYLGFYKLITGKGSPYLEISTIREKTDAEKADDEKDQGL